MAGLEIVEVAAVAAVATVAVVRNFLRSILWFPSQCKGYFYEHHGAVYYAAFG